MVTFVTDSGCDLPAGMNLPFELKVLPLRVYVRNEEYEDKVTLKPEELYRMELQGEVATTSLPLSPRCWVWVERLWRPR
ncbi:DegV family protein, partial [Fervidobacterium sp.]